MDLISPPRRSWLSPLAVWLPDRSPETASRTGLEGGPAAGCLLRLGIIFYFFPRQATHSPACLLRRNVSNSRLKRFCMTKYSDWITYFRNNTWPDEALPWASSPLSAGERAGGDAVNAGSFSFLGSGSKVNVAGSGPPSRGWWKIP